MSRWSTSRLARAARVGVLVLLVGTALATNVVNLGDLLSVNPAPNEEIAQRDLRFEPLRKFLPARATLGFVSDARDPVELSVRLMLAEFALTPLLLVSGPDQPMIVGDFSEAAAAAVARELNLTLVRDFGNGVALFARPRR